MLISVNTVYHLHCWDSFAVLSRCLSEQRCPDKTPYPENGGERLCGAHGQAEYVVVQCHKRYFQANFRQTFEVWQ